jgi:hypothetical protein
VIHLTFTGYRSTIAGGWVASLPPDEAAIERILASLAPRLFPDHIGRELCYQLRQHKSGVGTTELNVPPNIDPVAGTSGQWQTAIQGEVARLHTTCKAIAATAALQPAAILSAWDAIERQVHDPSFLTSGAYRRDLKGKRLLNLFWQHLRTTSRYPGDEETLTNDFVDTVRRVYGTAPPLTFPDFEELADRVRAVLNPVVIP